MKKIRTNSTLVSAKHGLVSNGQYTNVYRIGSKHQYAYELSITAKWASACSGVCELATPAYLQFQQGGQTATLSISLTGGFGACRHLVLPLTSSTAGTQKVAVTLQVRHSILSVPVTDAFQVRVA